MNHTPFAPSAATRWVECPSAPPRIPVPTITTPDWAALARHVKAHGAVTVNASEVPNRNAAHACLHRFGLGIRKHGADAYRIALL